jgi:hypothetical protein
MATRDHFAPNNPFPLLLSDHAQEPEQPSIGKAWDTVISSRTANAILIFTAAAIVFAIVTVGNPIVLFASVTTAQGSTSAPEASNGLSMPAFQSTAKAEALLPTAPRGDELLTAFKTASRGAKSRSLVQSIPGLGGRGRCTVMARPSPSPTRCPSTGRKKGPRTALAKASPGPNRENWRGTGPCGKCSVAGAKVRLAQLNPLGRVQSLLHQGRRRMRPASAGTPSASSPLHHDGLGAGCQTFYTLWSKKSGATKSARNAFVACTVNMAFPAAPWSELRAS